MLDNVFGSIFKKDKKTKKEDVTKIVREQDGSTHIDSFVGGGSHDLNFLNLESELLTDAQWIREYRKVSELPEVEDAIDDICQEAIVSQDDKEVFYFNLDNTEFSDKLKEKIDLEIKSLFSRLRIEEKIYDLFKIFYIDGRLYIHKVIDNKDKSKGIIEIDVLDSTRTKKINRNTIENINSSKIIDTESMYIYDPTELTDSSRFNSSKKNVLKLAEDSVCYIHSGIIDKNTKVVKGLLHKAVKPANQLALLEDSMVIYRLSRSSEKRVFYIDVGNLPKTKAEQYLTNIISKFKNKLVFDTATGKIKDNKNHIAIAEDFYLPRRDGQKGTEIDTLPAGSSFDQIDDILYFRKKLYKSLKIPLSRLEAETSFQIGRSSEITRDEVKFNKYVRRIRNRFKVLLLDLLRTQLLLKNIVSVDDWNEMSQDIDIIFNTDMYFDEFKETEIFNNRIDALSQSEQYTNKYVSVNYLRKKVLKLSQEEIEEMDKEIEAEKTKYKDNEDSGRY